jgi:putative protease
MPYDLETQDGEKLVSGRYLLSMRDMNRTAQLEALLDAGARSLKIEGRLKDAAYVKNVTAWYRQKLDAIFKRRKEYYPSSQGRIELSFTPNPERSFNRGFTDYFMHERTADLCNTITPKSMGERVGFVKEIRRDHIVVAGTASFANGDGLCYVSGAKGQEQLVGFRINRAEGNHLYPHRMPQGLKDGTVIYRNQDQAMEAVLSGKTSRRVLPLEWRLEETPQGFRLTAKQGSRCASKEYECEHQLARTDQTASITDVLSKVGDTIYEVTNTEISFSQPWFIPRSRLAEWRREVLVLLEQKNNTLTCLNEPPSNMMDLGKIKQQELDQSPLMTCRYCIRYQLGQCLRRNPQAVRGPLYLRGADGRRFLLRFDCKACQMTVEIER